MDNLKFIFQAIIGTPFWVWGIFIYVLFVGLKAAHTRVISLPKLFIIPVILVGIKYKLFLSGNSSNIIIYLLFITIGFGIGILIGYKTPIKCGVVAWLPESSLRGDIYADVAIQEKIAKNVMKFIIF
ncbi:hypothetical protein [Rickettsia endosymbiont of Orchestes rusci]|uniref:hypothetical protein n=1 Tax=Rickettsia endosymbiont of Orchestes rusci TaxID=3066250 RepID=UPI00313D475F